MKPMGYRDVYWCWYLNEPMVITYKGSHMFCRLCGLTAEKEGKEPDKLFLADHTFCAHILKPKKER